MGHGALGIGHGALGMGHWAWGMGHWALGMGLASIPHFLENRYTLKGFSLKLIQRFPTG